MWNADQFIQEYGDDAYWKAIDSAVIAVQLKDQQGAEHFAAVAKELTRRGYHKRRKGTTP